MNKNSYKINLNLGKILMIYNLKYMKMGIVMKDNFILSKDTVKEYIYKKMDINILETIIMMKKREMDNYILKMVNYIQVNLKMINLMVMDS